MTSPIIDFMLARISPQISDLKEPGPSDEEIQVMLKVAARAPDHGKLHPWRFILYRGQARYDAGERLARLLEQTEGPQPDARLQKERERFTRAPLVIGVISSPRPHETVPEWEMFLSGGAVAMNLLIGATGMGYGANWITNWYSGLEEGRRLLGLAPHERVIGFVHIGSVDGPVKDRRRPDVAELWSDYAGPWQG